MWLQSSYVTTRVNYRSMFRVSTVTAKATLDIICDVKLEYLCYTSHIHHNNKVSTDPFWQEGGSIKQPRF